MKCPYCAEDIADAAILCKHCRSRLDVEPNPPIVGMAHAEPPQASAPQPASPADVDLGSPAPGRRIGFPLRLAVAGGAVLILFVLASLLAIYAVVYSEKAVIEVAIAKGRMETWERAAAEMEAAGPSHVALYQGGNVFPKNVRIFERSIARALESSQPTQYFAEDILEICDSACARAEVEAARRALSTEQQSGPKAAMFNLGWLVLSAAMMLLVRYAPGPASDATDSQQWVLLGGVAAALTAILIFVAPKAAGSRWNDGIDWRVYVSFGSAVAALGLIAWRARQKPVTPVTASSSPPTD